MATAKKPTLTYDDFLRDVSPFQRPDVDAIHALMTARGCRVKVQPAKQGSVVSYLAPGKHGLTVANLVFRKAGVNARVYADHAGRYEDALANLPEDMQRLLEKAGACKRLLDPAACSPHCRMGNVFTLNGALHKKCRYSSFFFLLTEESTPHILTLLGRELDCRADEQ